MERATLFTDLAADPEKIWQLRKEALKAASLRRNSMPTSEYRLDLMRKKLALLSKRAANLPTTPRPRTNDLQFKR
jgi:hypothetical protein